MKESKFVHSVVIVKDNMYFIADRLSILYLIDLKSWTLKRVSFLKKNNGWWSLHYYKGCLYCTSFDDGRVAEYDLMTNKIEYFCPSESNINSKATYERNGYLWFVPDEISGNILIFSVKSKEFRIIPFQSLTGNNRISNKKIFRFSKNDECLCISTYSGESIIEINMDTFACKIIENPCSEPIYDVIRLRNFFYIITNNNKGTIVKYNSQSGELWELNTDSKCEYKKILTDGNNIFLDGGKKIFRYDNERNILHFITGFSKDVIGSNYKNLVYDNNRWVFLPWERNCFLEIIHDEKSVEKHIITIPIQDALDQNDYMMHEDEYSIADYVGLIENQ